MRDRARPPSLPVATASRRRAIAGAILGSVLEWYDFTIFGILALYIAKALFPQGESEAALMSTFLLFGVSFVSRPIGGALIGRFADRRGRKPALLLAMATMASATFAMALIPPASSIGIAAPALLLIARLAQGFSAGGEFGVANAFLIEWAPPGRRGLSGSLLSMTVALGTLLANATAAVVIATLSTEDMAAWGWRIPFALGGVLGVLVLWLRVRLGETPDFSTRGGDPDARPAPWRRNAGAAAVVFALTIYWTVAYYIFMVYMPTFARLHGGVSAGMAAISNTVAATVIALLVPVVGWLSDRSGRRPFLLASCLLAIVLVLPGFWLVAGGTGVGTVIAVQIAFAIAIALYSGPSPALFAELFPLRSRSSWPAVAYAFGTAIFGGFAPWIALWLTRTLDSPVAPAAYVILAAVVSLTALTLLPRLMATLSGSGARAPASDTPPAQASWSQQHVLNGGRGEPEVRVERT